MATISWRSGRWTRAARSDAGFSRLDEFEAVAAADDAAGRRRGEVRGAHQRGSVAETSEQLAARFAGLLELEESDVLEVLEANHNRRPLSLDRPSGSDDPDESSPSEWIGSEDKGFELAESRIALDTAIPQLGEREQLVLRLRFVEDMTQTQIADRIGCSQMHVSRILRRTLQQIREQVEGGEPAAGQGKKGSQQDG